MFAVENLTSYQNGLWFNIGTKDSIITTVGMADVMASTRQTSQLTTQALRRAGGLAIIYVILIFLLPVNHATMHAHHLSTFEFRMLLLALNLPTIVAWLAAFIGYAKLREYVQLVRKTPEGLYFDKLATGAAWLAWSLPIPAIIILLLNGIANDWGNFYPATIIIGNYLRLVFPLIAFSIIGVASRGLVGLAKIKFGFASSRIIAVLFLGAGVLYCLLTFKHFNPSSLTSTANPYFLPIWLMVLTIIVPYLYTWFVGLLAAYEITLFSRETHGVLYRQALRLVVLGLVVIIASSIALQYIRGVQPRIDRSTLDYYMVLSSVSHLIGGSGFVLMAIGAERLKRIEEV